MKLIRIDQEVWKFLMKNAVPLEDTPNSALRRLLGIDKKRAGRSKRTKTSRTRTDQTAFLLPVLEISQECRGKAEAKRVIQELEGKMKSQLKPVDHERLKSGQIRWKNTAQWARNELVTEGYLSKDSPRGVWEITEKGREYLKRTTPRSLSAEVVIAQ